MQQKPSIRAKTPSQKILILLRFSAFLLISTACGKKKDAADYDFETIFEKSGGTETATYDEVMEFYKSLDDAYISIKTYKYGETDSGKPLTLVTFNTDRTFDSEFAENPDTYKLLINNGIHPGEPDGIDATMMLMRDLAQEKIEAPKNVWIGAIAIYNVGGSLNRNSTSRTNQNGPKSYGFRGNARNYDLNRDFIKADTKNAQTFAEIYHRIEPDMFIDNHVSNGADYQYALTHLFTQHDKMGGDLGNYIHNQLQPELEKSLKEKDWIITPYVNVFNQVPETGFSQFMDSPRYSTGYTTLWNTVGMMVETHMLKPYKQRVEGTYVLMTSMIDILEKDGELISTLRQVETASYEAGLKTGKPYPIQFAVDSNEVTTYDFKGFEGEMIPSKITGQMRLKYDRSKPFTRPVKYYDNFKVAKEVIVPKGYLIPQGWFAVINRLRENDIEMRRLDRDTTINVETYHILSYKTRTEAYEGHYPHYATEVEKSTKNLDFRKGDYLIKTAQPALRYLIETLEPEAVDSFFNWNFFDTILQQKEHFSPYVWEDKAAELLDKDPELRERFQQKKDTSPEFSKNWYAQLDWLHKHSPNYEKAHLSYPVFRLVD